MSMTGVEAFDKTLNKTKAWLREIREDLHLESDDDAYIAARAVLQTLRDRLNPGEAADLAAQLPMLVRGFYYEGWHPADKPLVLRSEEDFLHEIGSRIGRGMKPSMSDPRRLAIGVFAVIRRHVTEGEIEDIVSTLPGSFAFLWTGAGRRPPEARA
jgi:uncharacterized protein (DUF2267 family)